MNPLRFGHGPVCSDSARVKIGSRGGRRQWLIRSPEALHGRGKRVAFRFHTGERLGCGLQRIAGEQVVRAMAEIDDDRMPREKTVHQVRKRCKRLRGLLRLVRPGLGKRYAAENAAVRDMARLLSGTRDLDVMLVTFEGLLASDDAPAAGPSDAAAFHEFVEARRRERAAASANADEQLAEFRGRMSDLAERIEKWRVAGGRKVVGGGFAKIYGKARDAMAAAYDDPSPERFHEWRKQAKYHWYHLQLTRRLWSPVMKSLDDEASRLSDLLGADHDLAVLLDHLPEGGLSSEGAAAIAACANARRAGLQRQARTLGQQLFLPEPSAWQSAVKRLWKVAP